MNLDQTPGISYITEAGKKKKSGNDLQFVSTIVLDEFSRWHSAFSTLV